MREAGKKKMETQLPHLWNPHKIKKIRQDETEIQNINLGGTCTRRLSPLGRKRLALAGRDMCRKIPLSVAPHHRFGLYRRSQIHPFDCIVEVPYVFAIHTLEKERIPIRDFCDGGHLRFALRRGKYRCLRSSFSTLFANCVLVASICVFVAS